MKRLVRSAGLFLQSNCQPLPFYAVLFALTIRCSCGWCMPQRTLPIADAPRVPANPMLSVFRQRQRFKNAQASPAGTAQNDGTTLSATVASPGILPLHQNAHRQDAPLGFLAWRRVRTFPRLRRVLSALRLHHSKRRGRIVRADTHLVLVSRMFVFPTETIRNCSTLFI
jgi:hypothetical protein